MNAVKLGDDAIQELARRLAQPDVTPGPGWPELPRGNDLRALAWALKDLCYAALNTEPPRAASAAAALRRLQVSKQAHAPDTPLAQEIGALADWTEGAANVRGGRMIEALAHFDAAEQGFRSLALIGPAAQTRVPRIIALTMLGRHEEAATCGEEVQREFLALGDRQAAGRVSLNLGNLSLQRDAYGPAARHFREAAVLFARMRDHEHSVMADIGLADALTFTGDFAEALRIYARARMRAAQHNLSVLEALIDESVALLDLARGQYRDALAGFEASRAGYERLAMPQHLAIAEKQLADAYLALRLLPESMALYATAQQKFEALDMPYERAWTLAQRGRALALMGDPTAAAEVLTAAANAFQTQDNAVGTAAVQLARAELGLSNAITPADFSVAQVLADEAAKGFELAGRAAAQARAQAIQGLCLLKAGQPDAAASLLDRTLALARDLQLVGVQGQALSGMGSVALVRGDEAAARQAFERAIELFEDQRRTLPGDELRSAFLGDHLAPYRQLLGLALLAHERTPGPQAAVAVLRELDRVRATTLSERVVSTAVTTDDESTQVLRTRLNWLYHRTQRLDVEEDVPEALNDERRRLEHELLELARRQRMASPAVPKSETDGKWGNQGDWTRLPEQLLPEDAIIEYGLLADELFACVVTRQGVSIFRRLADWPAVSEAQRALRFQMDSLRHGATPVQQHLPILTRRVQIRLQQLHALVWAPLAEALIDCRRVMVIPCGPLSVLPFAALTGGQSALGEHLQMALASSARLAARGLIRPPVSPIRVQAFGESTRLPHADVEARRVASLYGSAPAWTGAEASLKQLLAHADEADVLHLACHGEFRADNPMFSALHLADAALTVECTEHLKLLACTVVLIACDTGLADTRQGDEMFGLVRAFLVAGASRVVASLWPVDDAVTELFMVAFHTALLGGAQPAAALQHAQATVRQTHPHPFYWAAFVLHGGW